MTRTQSELRLETLVDERELVHGKHESKLAEIATRDDKNATHADQELLRGYRERLSDFDVEIADLMAEAERAAKALEESRAIRRVLSGKVDGVEISEDGEVVYRTMAEYARDVLLTSNGRQSSQIQRLVDSEDVQRAAERQEIIKRVNNTLSSNVAGLIPPQHISQIFQVIQKSRPIVESALRADLNRGTLTFPVVTTRPVVAVQSAEKTAAGDTGMVIDMVTATASTYLGGGDLSWQAINWSTPNALELWFDLVAADYALKTETDAATVISSEAFQHKITTLLSSTATFAEFMTAVGAGAAKVYADSGRIANTVYMAPDRYWYIFGTTSSAFAQFTTVSSTGVGPALNFVQSRGLNAGEIIVGDRNGLLVAETPGAPVELRVVEPAIGGVEVGLIGAFEAVVVDDGAFAHITTAS